MSAICKHGINKINVCVDCVREKLLERGIEPAPVSSIPRCEDCAPEYTRCWNDGSKCSKRPLPRVYHCHKCGSIHADGPCPNELAPVGGGEHLTEFHNLGNDLEEWCEVRVRKDLVPKGASLVEAYLTDREIIVMGQPKENDENHNCDAMGCGTVSHVIYRLPLPITKPSHER